MRLLQCVGKKRYKTTATTRPQKHERPGFFYLQARTQLHAKDIQNYGDDASAKNERPSVFCVVIYKPGRNYANGTLSKMLEERAPVKF